MSGALPRAIARNWRLKISAFGLALVLWGVVQANLDGRGGLLGLEVPVVAQVNDMDWMLEGDPSPANVRVSLEAPPNVLAPLRPQSAVVQIPVDRVNGRDSVIQLRRDWVRLEGGSGYVVQEISPATVRISFQRTSSELLPVALRTTGELPEGLALAAPVGLQPQTVRVRGAAPRVEAADSVVLEPLDLSEVESSGIYTVDVDTGSVSGLMTTPSQVSLGVRLEEASERILAGVPVTVDTAGERAQDIEVLPRTLQVTLRGARTPVASTDPDAVRAVVPAAAVEGLEVGYQRRVPVVLRGVPDLVRGFAPVDSVTVRLPPDGGTVPTADDTLAPPTETLPSQADSLPTEPETLSPATDTTGGSGAV
ncbi:MAG: hypothetical protein KY453_10795 [Gemmatimonadetes bacterium]|nr:hypothetical protein [Gemmatimonadota bacterium]